MKQAADNRSGVALIVVLGFLSIMVMMAVAFLTQARMERMVADSTLEAMRGRQILRTALNAAMNDYSGTLWDQNPPLVIPTESFQVFTSEPPPGGSVSHGGRTLGDDDIALLVGEVEDWIPRKYRTPTVTNAVEDAEWILVRENPSSASSRILGRYAYVCFDMSGGIDANLVGRAGDVGGWDARAASNRVRRSVRQVPMRTLPEVLDAGTFQTYRSGWKGFDSLYSLIKLTDGKAEDGSGSAARWQPERKEVYGAALASNLVSDLTPYSMSAFRGGRYNRATGLWTPSPVLLNDSTDWTTVLSPISGQFAGGWRDWIANAIYDYTHNGRVPLGLDYPSPKNVPMFNEVNATYTLTETPAGDGTSDYQLNLRLEFEFWYPFPSADNDNAGTFQLAAPSVGGSAVAPAPNNQIWIRAFMRDPGILPVQLGAAVPAPGSVDVPAQYNGGRPYAASSAFTYQFPILPFAGTNRFASNMRMWIQGARVVRPVYLGSTAGNADMLPGVNGNELNLAENIYLQAAGDNEELVVMAATDPRLNHDASGQWVKEEASTLGDMNGWFVSSPADFQAEGTNLYCRNGPMQTPAELGLISTGQEWETIDLCTDDAVDLLSGLVVDTNLWIGAVGRTDRAWTTTNVFYTNGTINPNTRSSNVLLTAFVDLPTHEVPNVDSDRIAAAPLSETDGHPDAVNILARLVEEILEETESGSVDNCFQAGTDWVRIPCMRQGGALASLGLNNNQRESLIRNTWGLFSPMNSLFTVVVIAQTIKEGPGNVGIWNANDDMVTGERRAVALVWRDPFKTGRNLHHEMYVRMFRHLND